MDVHQACLALLRARFGDDRDGLPVPDAEGFMALLNLAGRHGVAPALAGGLRNLAADNPSWGDAGEFLGMAEEANRHRNTGFIEAAAHLAALLEDHGIACVFLKGAATVLADPAGAPWRPLSDLDVLVPVDRIEEAARLLKAAGYRQSDYVTGFAEQLHHHYPALTGEDGTMIELHVRLMQDAERDPVPPDAVFAMAGTVVRNGQSFRLPCPEHRMFHLLAHAQISNWGRVLRQVSLRDLLEARHVATQHAIDWDSVDRSFRSIGARRELDGFLAAAHDLIGLEFPYGEARRRQAERWAGTAVRAFRDPGPRWRTAMRMTAAYVAALLTRPQRLRLAWLTLVSPSRRQDFLRVMRSRLSDPAQRS